MADLKVYFNKIMERTYRFPVDSGCQLETIGSDYGGWVIPADYLSDRSVCYCVGAGLDISFDIGLAQKYSCEVHVFDPTPRSILHFKDLKERVLKGQGYWRNDDRSLSYEVSSSDLESLVFHEVGVWNEDTTLRFFAPKDATHISHSALNLQGTDDYFEAEVKRLSTIMKEQGHERIDLLKIDIEGAEYKVIDDIVSANIDVRVLCVEFDESANNNLGMGYMRRIKHSIDQLVAYGFKIVHKDNSNNFTLVRDQAKHTAI